MSKHLDAMLAELDSLDSYETKAEAAAVMAQINSEMALDLYSRMPRVPTHIPTIRVPKAEMRVPFLSPPPVHRAGIPVLATAAAKKPKKTAAEVAYVKGMKEAEKFAKADEKAMKEAEKLAKAEEKARAKAAKDAEKAYAAYQKEQVKIAKAFEKARTDALKASDKAREKARTEALKVSAPAKKAAAPAGSKAPTKAVLEGEVLRLRTLLASRGIPY
jgi:hypothetical protein